MTVLYYRVKTKLSYLTNLLYNESVNFPSVGVSRLIINNGYQYSYNGYTC